LANQVVVITGASSGIGAELARQLGARGDKVVLAARRESQLYQVAEGIGANARVVATDVRSRAEVERLRDRSLEAFGEIDVWVNNAGRGISRKVLDLTDAEIDEMLAVNLKSAIYGMQAVVPYFVKRGRGHLINVSSFLGRVPLATHRSIYSASKSALNTLTAQLRMDLAREAPGVQISTVMPGVVTTEFAANALGGSPSFGGSGAPGQTAEQVAATMVNLIDHPVPELYTNPTSHDMAVRYYQDVAAFEAEMLKQRR
jgi:short-subunit dehydrogenase